MRNAIANCAAILLPAPVARYVDIKTDAGADGARIGAHAADGILAGVAAGLKPALLQ